MRNTKKPISDIPKLREMQEQINSTDNGIREREVKKGDSF